MLNDFKKFILRGNVMDLAVAVVVGAAFNSVVQSLVRDFITPLIKGINPNGTLVAGTWKIGSRFVFNWGDFLNTIISFLIIAAVVFFLVVQPVNKLVAYSNRNKESVDDTMRSCPECCSDIPKQAKRCKYCTAEVKPEKS